VQLRRRRDFALAALSGTLCFTLGLRERKKERTAQAIEDAALRLFAAQGFNETTIAQIAQAADVAPRTFFAYYPSKESVLFGDFEPALESLAEHLQTRGQNSVLDALRAWIAERLEYDDVPDERARHRRTVIASNEPLLAHQRQLGARFEALIAQAAAEEMATNPAGLHPRLLAAAAAAALNTLRPDPSAPSTATSADRLRAVDDAFAFLRGGLAALDRRRSTGG
jgi:AcrR family transcriptional regulator